MQEANTHSYIRSLKRSFKLYSKTQTLSIDNLNKSTMSLINSNLKRKTNHLDLDNIQMSSTSINAGSMTSLMPFHVKNRPKHNLLVRNLKAKWNNVNRDVLHTLYEIYNKSKRLRHNLSSQALKQFDMFTGQMFENMSTDAPSASGYNYYLGN